MDHERQVVRTVVRVLAWLLFLAGGLPFDVYGSEALWPWQGLADASAWDAWALLAPLLASAALFFLSSLVFSKVALALGCLGVMSGLLTLAILQAGMPHALPLSNRLADGLPLLFARQFGWLVAALAITAAGLRLGRNDDRRILHLEPEGRFGRLLWVRSLLGAGLLGVGFFFLMPWRGEVPLGQLFGDIFQALRQLPNAESGARLAVTVLTLGPFLLCLVAQRCWFPLRQDSGAVLFWLVVLYLPVLTLISGARGVLFQPAYALVHFRSGLLVAGVTVGVAFAVSALVEGAWFDLPGLFERLTFLDRRLAQIWLTPHPEQRFAEEERRLSILLRPFWRRRLRLWIFQGMGGWATPSSVPMGIGFLLEHARNEQAGEQTSALSRFTPALPAWARRGRTELLVAVGLVLWIGLNALAAAGRPSRAPWSVRGELNAVERLLTHALPDVVAGMSRGGPPEGQALTRALQEAEPFLPGLRAGVERLVRLGAEGRWRVHALKRAQAGLNSLFRQAGLPYYFWVRMEPSARDFEPPRDLLTLMSYRLLDSRIYWLAGSRETFNVLVLSRMDKQAITENYVGATESEETFVTLFLDRLDDFLDHRFQEMLRDDGSIAEQLRRSLGEDLSLRDGAWELQRKWIANRLAEGVIRHELHHRWFGLEPEPPRELWEWLQEYSEDSIRAVTSEVGAFLGELNGEPGYSRLRLALMLDDLQHAQRLGSHELAALFVIKEIFRVSWDDPVTWRLLGLMLTSQVLGTIADEELAVRLRGLHQRLFGIPAPEFVGIESLHFRVRGR